MTEGPPQRRSGSRSLERGLDILLLLAEAPKDLGVTALAGQMGISKGTIHRLLSTLVARDFVAYDRHTKEYRLAGKALQIGLNVEGRIALYTESAPTLETLSLHTGETAALSIVIGRQLLPIAQYVSRQFPRKVIRLGMAFPRHAGAIGRATLAFGSDALLESYVTALRPEESVAFPIDDLSSLRARLALIRTRGYEINLDEHGISVHSLAFPLLNVRGQVIGGINIFGPPERWTEAKMQSAIPGCVAAIQELALRLRYLSPPNNDEDPGDLVDLVGNSSL